MYAPAYGYGPGNSNSPSPFNPNGAPPPPHHPHQQQQQQHHQQHHQQQQQQQQLGQPQHMMYNQQQYGVGPGQGHPQSQFPGAPGPSMGGGGNAGAMGMLQNNGMAQMAGGHVPQYQTPYSSSPYGGNVPTSTAANLPPNFIPPTSGAPSFPMNAMNMNPQHQTQRMQPPPPSSTPTQPGPRASPFAGIPHNTPPNAGPQSQFSPPQQSNQAHLQTPNNNQQVQSGTILTPQTPNFPPGQQSANTGQAMATPLSPGSESREKERVTLLLDINRELLMEVMKIQAAQAAQVEAKKEETAPAAASPEGGDKEKSEQEKVEKEKAEKSKPSSREYVECMRRLQSNLAYLAAIADRSHKPSSQIPPHPAIMTAPIVTPKPALPPASSPNSDSKDSDEKKSDEKKAEEDENRAEILKEQYKKLQALFPGVDPKKEPQMQGGNPAMRAQAQQQAASQMQAQKQQQQQQRQGQGQIQGQSQDPNSQQKLQNDLLRQKMMMQQQAQQNAQQQMALNMQNMNQQGLGQNR